MKLILTIIGFYLVEILINILKGKDTVIRSGKVVGDSANISANTVVIHYINH